QGSSHPVGTTADDRDRQRFPLTIAVPAVARRDSERAHHRSVRDPGEEGSCMSPTNTNVRATDTRVPSVVGSQLPTPVPVAEYDRCPVTEIVRLIGDRWSLVTLTLLGRRPYRFNELHRSIEGISQRMLTRTLRGLEASGLVLRTVYATVPPSVDYRLT